MGIFIHFFKNYYHVFRHVFFTVLVLFSFYCNAQAPANDDCTNAINIPIPANGFGLGNFTSAQADLTNATVQTGEAYAPAIFVAGLDKKSVWYKFSIPTIRAVRVTLTQPGVTITAGNAGFAVYYSNACLPSNANISTKLTPIVTFGNTYHPCVPAGDYLVQVSSKVAANGPITIGLEISDQTGAAYDHPNQAYSFGTAANHARKIDFDTECQSIEDSLEICTALSNYREYHKSAWFTFTTPSYFDYIAVTLSGNGTTTYFPGGGANILKKFGYNLYQGNVVTTPFNTLPVIDGCDSMQTNGHRAAVKQYRCDDLQPNTTYSIQLFFHKDFKDILRLGMITGGIAPTAAPLPVSGMPATNALGILNASAIGTTNTMFDYFGCNSRLSATACNPALPSAGITIGGVNYNLSSFGTFTLSGTSAILFRPSMTTCGARPIIRLFKQAPTVNCADLDTANLVGTASYNVELECLSPGNYVIQVLGTDAPLPLTSYYSSTPGNNYDQCLFTNLGSRYRLDMIVYTRKTANRYSLNVTGAFDSIRRVGTLQQPLAPGVAYQSASDTIGCQPTLRPWDTTCSPINDKVVYRQFEVADSGTVNFSTLTYAGNITLRYKLYKGDANALAAAQNVFNFPDRVTGIVPKSLCFDGYLNCNNKSACVTPGTYTFTTMGSVGDVGRADRPTFTFERTRTLHHSPFTAQDMGSIMDTLGVNGGVKKSDVDFWSCDDNAAPINGYQPCVLGGRPATKAIYRQFYLKDNALVRIANTSYYSCNNFAYGTKTLFYGKATDGFGGLSPVGNQWNCFSSAQTANGCTFLPAGWYTVVSYGTGPSYDSTTRLVNVGGRYNSHVSYKDEFTITITPACPGPKFNRPYKASINTGTGQPHLIQWAVSRPGSTAAYPRTDTTYSLPTENFNCTLDTPFTSHPIKSCELAANRVAYYVFKTTAVCFLQINAGGYFATLYDKDVRTDSLQFANAKPIQFCNNTAGFIQYCFFQPGTYTLVVFAKDANSCSSVTPKIYIDQIGYSRFDYAANAYDFDVIPPDNTYHFGKVGDVNPLNSGRKPSTDFFYCTTGAFATDPTNAVCNTRINPNVYNTGPNKPMYDSVFPASNNVARRNLWYTFVANDAGTVRVKVENKTIGRGLQPKFAVYKSDVNGTLPFATILANGEVDSTISQGLSFVGTNLSVYPYYYCYNFANNLSFYRDPCTSVPTRYYVLVENVNGFPAETGGQLPNTQVEVSVLIDSINLVLPKFDHYYQAGDFGTVGVGRYTGPTDNYSCATRDATDPINTCNKTLWYKFNSTITGNVRFRIKINNADIYDYGSVQLFRQTIPGDSTSAGLKVQPYNGSLSTGANGFWTQNCVSVGTYYLVLSGCSRVNEYVYPEIELIEAVGDYCNRAIPAAINGAGSVTATVLVNCHTIGTDYGEFGPKLTCPPNANTGEYKSSWFRMDIGGTDTLDVTTYLVENTNASSGDIKYRLMTGDCAAMQEQSCVLDALTQNTYQCLVPGQSYYVQVFTPVFKNNVAVTGTIDLKLSAIAHADTCAPLTNCLASANFNTVFDCTLADSVKFVNFSTYGTNISYKWDFGYNGQTSADVSPSFFYPALPTDQAYTVKLVVTNTGCLQKDSVTRTVMVPGRPFINLGADIAQCNSTAPIKLTATSHPGATYLWQNNSTADTFRVTATGNNNYWVRVNYNGCSRRDTVKVLISPISARPLQQIALCTDSVQVNVRRGFGETYRWNTDATTQSVYMSNPGYYWVDIFYFNCVYRDSFLVNRVNVSRPLGNDTTVCLSKGGYILNASMPGALSYSWQNGSSADTFLVTSPGQYRVNINFGNCTLRDTVQITGYPAPLTEVTDTIICAGESYFLPWGTVVTVGGTYRDTIQYKGGCDSLIRRVNLSVKPIPDIGRDTMICFSRGSYILNAFTPGVISYNWQDGYTSTAFTVTAPGQYWVQANYGTCFTSDTVNIIDFASPLTVITDTSICIGSSLTLPWGQVVRDTGSYLDTIPSTGGCDSLIRIYNLTIITRPDLGNDASVNTCSGNSINLSNYFNTPGLSVEWIYNNNPLQDPTSVNIPGSYRLTAVNAGGCSDTAFLFLTINAKPALGNDTTVNICPGENFNLAAFYNLSGLAGNWTVNGNPVTTNSVNAPGVYRLIAANNFSCADTALLTLRVNSNPVLGNDSSINICSGDTFDLTGVFNASGVTSNWTLNGTAVTNPAAISATGVYRLIATNTTACNDTATVTIGFNPKPGLGNDFIQNICQGSNFNLNNVFPIGGLTSSWTINGTPVINPASVNVGGQYQLIANNSFGCTDTALITLTPGARPSLGNDTAVSTCSGTSFNLTPVFSAAGLTVNWTLNAVTISNPQSVSSAGSYQLIATTTTGCSDTAVVSVVVQQKPAIGNDTAVSICEGNIVNLTTLYNLAGLTSLWSINGNPVVNPATIHSPGEYKLIAGNNFNCTDTAVVLIIVNPRPVLGDNTTLAICQGNTQNLNNVYNIAGLTSTWTVNGNTVGNPSGVSVAGVYQLIVTNPFSCADTAAVTVIIKPRPSVGNDTAISICQGYTVNLTSLYHTTGLNSNWTRNGTAVANPTAASVAGIYRLIVSNNYNCTDTALVTVTVNAKPNLGNDTVVYICAGNAFNLASLFNTGTNINSWTINGAVVSNPISVTTPGSYRLITSTSSGCADTVSVSVNIVANPVVVTNDPAIVCAPQTVNLTAPTVTTGSSPGLIFTYWTDSTANIAYNNPGNAANGVYYIKGTNNDGCFNVKPVRVTYYQLPVVNAGPDISVCYKDSATLRAIVSNITAPVRLQWEPVNGGGIVSPASPVTVVKPAGTQQYIVTVRDTYGCNFNISDTILVTMKPPVPAFAGNDTIAVTGIPHQLFATGGVGYIWSPGNIFNNPNIANPLATFSSGSTLVSVIVRDIAGCKGYDSILVKTYNGITYYVPNAFSPNGDAKNDIFRPIPAGIVSTEFFRIYNRYGELMFETNQWMKGWDGTYKNKPQPIGNYIWVLKGKGQNGQMIEMKGNVVLVR